MGTIGAILLVLGSIVLSGLGMVYLMMGVMDHQAHAPRGADLSPRNMSRIKTAITYNLLAIASAFGAGALAFQCAQ